MPHKKPEQNIFFEFQGEPIKPPKIKRNKYGEDIVHIGAEIPYTLWQELYADSATKKIPLMQNVRNILADYYASLHSKKENDDR